MSAQLAPPIGACFTCLDKFWQQHSFVVKGYAKEYRPVIHPDDWLSQILYDTQQETGPDKLRLAFCGRSEAEYVIGSGVSGCIAKISEIVVQGFLAWDAERLAFEESNSLRLQGRPIF